MSTPDPPPSFPNSSNFFEVELENMSKHVLVTGASSGIGLALCKLLIRDHSCYVYLGSRNVPKGEAALKTIIGKCPHIQVTDSEV